MNRKELIKNIEAILKKYNFRTSVYISWDNHCDITTRLGGSIVLGCTAESTPFCCGVWHVGDFRIDPKITKNIPDEDLGILMDYIIFRSVRKTRTKIPTVIATISTSQEEFKELYRALSNSLFGEPIESKSFHRGKIYTFVRAPLE